MPDLVVRIGIRADREREKERGCGHSSLLSVSGRLKWLPRLAGMCGAHPARRRQESRSGAGRCCRLGTGSCRRTLHTLGPPGSSATHSFTCPPGLAWVLSVGAKCDHLSFGRPGKGAGMGWGSPRQAGGTQLTSRERESGPQPAWSVPECRH